MRDIQDVMDVTINDLSPEEQAQLKDAIDQFQQKCLMSFGKNRSGVSYLKSDMPRVLLPGEPDTTSAQEKQEALQAFRETIDTVMVKHHTAFLNMFKQMMIGVFGPGMERTFSRVSPQASTVEVEKLVLLNQFEMRVFSHLYRVWEANQSNHLRKVWGVNRSIHLYKAMEVAQSNNRSCIKQCPIGLHMEIWRSVLLEFHLTLLTG
jgi:hypothetical protein